MKTISAVRLKSWLHDGREIAFLDLREHGQYGEAHPLMVISLPFSRLETRLERLVPNRRVRMVLMDDGEMVVARRAATILGQFGYEDVNVLDRGVRGWVEAGYGLFPGVNVYSKAFGELAAEVEDVPQIDPGELHDWLARGKDLVVVDGRPVQEYRKMNIPGSLCCPNGELVLRIGEIAPDPGTTVVVNCAGRTRSIIGAATLRRFGVSNPVVALRNGTMGWRLAGFQLEHGSDRLFPAPPRGARLEQLRARAADHARAAAVRPVSEETLRAWLGDTGRTTYLLDVRTEDEYHAGTWPGAVWAPGGQLIQATDEWIAVRHARVVLVDPDRIRSVMVARWLCEMGWEAAYLDADLPAAIASQTPVPGAELLVPALPVLASAHLPALPQRAAFVDLRPGMIYRNGHIRGARWAIRPGFAAGLRDLAGRPLVLITQDLLLARAAAVDLRDLGHEVLGVIADGPADWERAGFEIEATPDSPADADCIDHLFFVHDRHDGNDQAARRYLEWECDLLSRMDADERRAYRLPHHA